MSNTGMPFWCNGTNLGSLLNQLSSSFSFAMKRSLYFKSDPIEKKFVSGELWLFSRSGFFITSYWCSKCHLWNHCLSLIPLTLDPSFCFEHDITGLPARPAAALYICNHVSVSLMIFATSAFLHFQKRLSEREIYFSGFHCISVFQNLIWTN